MRVAHPVPAYGLRVAADGRTLAYTGDTGPCAGARRRWPRADLLLWPRRRSAHGEENPDDLHLTGREAGEVAARNAVPRLVITHVPPWYDVAEMLAEASAVYVGDVTAAAPGATYDV